MSLQTDTLLFSHLDDMPPALVDHVLADFRAAGVPVVAEARQSQPAAALEDYIPTAIVLFILKPFLESFLKKAGEDSYTAFKSTIKRCYEGARLIKVRLMVSGAAKAGSSLYCATFSVYSKSQDGRTLKFLFSADTTDQSLDQAIAKMLDTIREGNAPLNASSRIRYITLLVYDTASETWMPHREV